MLVTNEMIYEELKATRQLLAEIIDRTEVTSIEEISLNKASKLLKRGQQFIIKEVQAGRLKAMRYRDKNDVIRYRFRLSDIYRYQSEKTSAERLRAHRLKNIESSESIGRRIFG